MKDPIIGTRKHGVVWSVDFDKAMSAAVDTRTKLAAPSRVVERLPKAENGSAVKRLELSAGGQTCHFRCKPCTESLSVWSALG